MHPNKSVTGVTNYNMASEDDGTLLVIIMDTNPFTWASKQNNDNNNVNSTIPFGTFMDHLLVFLHAYLMLNQQNTLSILASHFGQSHFLYPKPTPINAQQQQIPDISEVTQQITEKLKHVIATTELQTQQNENDSKIDTSSCFSGAFSLALCYINRTLKQYTHLKPRILIFQAAPDSASQYIPIMNCIFSAQKKSIVVDSVVLGKDESGYLQQASHMTGGVYMKPLHPEGLLQYLMTCFLVEPGLRNSVNLPLQTSVDYRATCFCHKKVIEIGFVCSVCLSVFCSWTPVCSTCRSKFPLQLPKKVIKK